MAAGRLLRTKISTPASGDFTIILRVGINLGDVIHDDARIYGDGINITARLETLAEPGGVLGAIEMALGALGIPRGRPPGRRGISWTRGAPLASDAGR